ncbi:hypothetical protein M8994_18320 [Brucella sp. 21LCYQ03]|nr:hypothetical protein [Brucella sp. 21LCYQ03]
MDIREKLQDDEETYRSMIDDIKSGLHTALTGTVTAFYPETMTVDIQPNTKSAVRQPDGTVKTIPYPLLTGVPVSFPGGGGASLTFPIKPGDEAMVTFASRSTDAWVQSGGEQNPMDARTQDLSDGIAHVGVRSSGKLPTGGASADSTELRTDDGKTRISFNGGGIAISSDQNMTVDAPDLIINGISFMNHVHSGVVPGGSNTEKPVQ